MIVFKARLTTTYQIAIPKEARKRLHLQAGDTVYLALEGNHITLRGPSESWTESSRGLGAELWRRAGGARAIASERDSWDGG